MSYTRVDLSRLPPPEVIEPLSYEEILAEMKARVAEIAPEMAPVLALESEPAVKVLQICAGFILLARARVNDAAKAVMLATSTGSNLDHLAALFGVQRLVLQPATTETPAVYEDDESLRYRTQLALEGLSTAGPRAAYEFHALGAHPDVKDVLVAGPTTPGMSVQPGDVEVYILSRIGDGVPAPAVLSAVAAALNDEMVRPLGDHVTVAPAKIQTYHVIANVHLEDGVASADVEARAKAALDRYLEESHALGETVARSGILGALHQSGVDRVDLVSPAADIIPPPDVAPYCVTTSITVFNG